MKVLLAGATGLVGGRALLRLLGDARCTQVLAPTRRPLSIRDARLLNPVLDFEQLPDDPALWQVDAAICALGSTIKQAGSQQAFRRIDHGYPLQIAKLVHTQGCNTFVLNSAVAADPQSRFFYSRVKGELERDLRALGFASLTLVRPGLIAGERVQRRTGEHLLGVVLQALGPVLPRAMRVNPADCIAAAMVEAALQPAPGEHVVASAQLVGD